MRCRSARCLCFLVRVSRGSFYQKKHPLKSLFTEDFVSMHIRPMKKHSRGAWRRLLTIDDFREFARLWHGESKRPIDASPFGAKVKLLCNLRCTTSPPSVLRMEIILVSRSRLTLWFELSNSACLSPVAFVLALHSRFSQSTFPHCGGG